MNIPIPKETLWLWLFRVTAILMLGLAVIGAIKSYSPVPYWDMWDGYLRFYTSVSEGDFGAWWAQHNEHRIVLSRILFWIDISFFAGLSWFLIITNYVLMICTVSVFYKFLQERVKQDSSHLAGKVLRLFIIAILFSWIQVSNLTWGFQSQFILAQLLPLLAFYVLHLSFTSQKSGKSLFLTACFLGVLSVGTMANGILALPLMLVLGLILRISKIKLFILALLAITMIGLYFYGYHSPDGHGSIKAAVLNNPIDVFKFLLLYIGGPFYYMTGEGSFIIAQLAGIFLIGSAICFGWQSLKKPDKHSLQLALLSFILYVGGTALGTAGGRVVFGLEQALSSRYQTPVLMAWVALLVLFSPLIISSIKKHPYLMLSILFVLLVSLLPIQFKALQLKEGEHFEKEIAALALELNIKDQDQIVSVFPSAEWALAIVEKPVEFDLSIFGTPKIKNVAQLIGRTSSENQLFKCSGSVDEISEIDGVSDYVRIRGWMYQNSTRATPEVIHIVNGGNKIIGYALTGQPRADIAKEINNKAGWSGFKGYLLSQEMGGGITLEGHGKAECKLSVTIPLLAFDVKKIDIEKGDITVNASQVVSDNSWLGSDFYRTTVSGYKVYGSFITGDQDTGAITLKLKKGDSLFYRSGPVMTNQRIIIKSEKTFLQKLPQAIDWIKLEFSNKHLAEEFDVILEDNGAGWGEWSAIVVKTDD